MARIRVFRVIAFIEGVTTLVLFLVAMPLKYWAGHPAFVPPAGWIHGMAFLAYILALVPGLWGMKLTVTQWLRTVVAGFLPFGTFLNDPMLKRKQMAGLAP